MYQELVKEQRLFSNISCYHTGSIDPGIIVVEGKLVEGVAIEDAEAAVDAALKVLQDKGITEEELHKSINRLESMVAFEDMNLLARANNLAFYELLGDADMMNTEMTKYALVTAAEVKEVAREIFRPGNSNTLHYLKQTNEPVAES
ncbi:hypothetical protein D9M68_724300 [compost metagenome]